MSGTKATGNSEAVPPAIANGFLIGQRRVDENQRVAEAVLGNLCACQGQGIDYDPMGFDSSTCLADPGGTHGIFLQEHKTTG